jgi:hypothetical protein
MTKRNIIEVDLTSDDEMDRTSIYKDFLARNKDTWLSKKTFSNPNKPIVKNFRLKVSRKEDSNKTDLPCSSRQTENKDDGHVWWMDYLSSVNRLKLPIEPKTKTISTQTDPEILPKPAPVWTCSVCLQPSDNRVIWSCSHIYCNDCSEIIKHRRYNTRYNFPRCPICRKIYSYSIPINDNLL